MSQSKTSPSTPEIIFSDSDLIVVNKPTHMHSADGATSDLTDNKPIALATWLANTIGEDLRLASEDPKDAGLVQRLDCFTSGLIIAARRRGVWFSLRAMIKAQQIKKSYRAVLEGHLNESTTLEVAIGSPYRHAKKVRVYESLNKKRTQIAHTTFEVLKYLNNLNATEVKVIAPEGRRHQIRACAAYIGHPLFGDYLYGAQSETNSTAQFWLHAESLSFVHPNTKKLIELNIAVPNGWADNAIQKVL